MLRRVLFAAVAVAAVSVCGSAGAVPVLDQASVPEAGLISPSHGAIGGATLVLPSVTGETFTVGLNGELTRIDIGVFNFSLDQPANGFQFDLYGAGPAALFSTHVAAGDVPRLHLSTSTWDEMPIIDLSGAHLHVQSGDQMAFVLTPDPGQIFTTALVQEADGAFLSYGGGFAFMVDQFNPRDPINNGTADYAFRTYVQTGVPEPAQWVLMLLGFAGAGIALRRMGAIAA